MRKARGTASEMRLRFARLSRHDIPLLLPIEHEAYPDPWTWGMFRQETENQVSHFFVAFAGEILVGYAGFWLEGGEAHITKLTVRVRYRRQGFGQMLLEMLLERARALNAEVARLEVRESNTAARNLYARFGFAEVGLRKQYYSKTKETAVVMAKLLGSAEPEHTCVD